jgi:hypothetical protein
VRSQGPAPWRDGVDSPSRHVTGVPIGQPATSTPSSQWGIPRSRAVSYAVEEVCPNTPHLRGALESQMAQAARLSSLSGSRTAGLLPTRQTSLWSASTCESSCAAFGALECTLQDDAEEEGP